MCTKAVQSGAVFPVMIGLITVGLGQGTLVALLFNVLVTAKSRWSRNPSSLQSNLTAA